MSTKLSLLLLSVAFSGVIYAEGAPTVAPMPATPAGTEVTPPAADEAKEGKDGKEGKEGKGGMVGLIKKLDTNKDGILQAAEIDAEKSDKVKAKLKMLDTNADGMVDAAEIEAGKKAKHNKEHGHDHGEAK